MRHRGTVTLQVSRIGICPNPSPTGSLGLTHFATRTGGQPPLAPHVNLLLGNEHVATRAASQINSEKGWRICPPSGSYADAACPFSALDTVFRFGWRNVEESTGGAPYARLRVQPGAPVEASACAVLVASTPTGLDPFRATEIVPEQDRLTSCMDAFTIQVWTNEQDQITAVNLILGSP